MDIKNNSKEKKVKLPEGCFCGHNCADGCIYWNPYKCDDHGRQWCNWYYTHCYPHDRQVCLSYKD